MCRRCQWPQVLLTLCNWRSGSRPKESDNGHGLSEPRKGAREVLDDTHTETRYSRVANRTDRTE
eukprot:6313724-Alexandrium_andersonii.AAC.1